MTIQERAAAQAAGERQPIARIIAASAIGCLISIATVIVFPFAVFAAPIAEDFGWSKALVSALIGPALLVTIPAQPLIGWAVARYPKRNFAVVSMCLLGVGTIIIANAPADMRLFPLLFVLAVVLSAPATNTVYNALISETVDRRRGLALGATSAFAGLGIAVLPLMLTYIIEASSWRVGYLALSALAFISAIALFFLLPSRGSANMPTESRLLRGDAKVAFRDPVFWQLAVLFFLLPMVANAIPLHLPLILEGRGASPKVAATSLSVLGLVMILARPLSGILLDIMSIRVVLLLLLAGPLVGSVALVLLDGPLVAILAAAGFGLCIGGEFVCLGYLVSRAFAVRSFGLVYGLLAMTVALGVSVGPMFVSAFLGLSGGYALPLQLTIGLTAIGMMVTMTLREARFANQDGGETS